VVRWSSRERLPVVFTIPPMSHPASISNVFAGAVIMGRA
jgi:hypothetical protein